MKLSNFFNRKRHREADSVQNCSKSDNSLVVGSLCSVLDESSAKEVGFFLETPMSAPVLISSEEQKAIANLPTSQLHQFELIDATRADFSASLTSATRPVIITNLDVDDLETDTRILNLKNYYRERSGHEPVLLHVRTRLRKVLSSLTKTFNSTSSASWEILEKHK